MKATVQKWGNSLAIRIPKNISMDARVSEGSNINIMIKNGNIIPHAGADLLAQASACAT